MLKRNILRILLAIFMTATARCHDLPVVAIANYGSILEIEISINKGIKEELRRRGYVEGKTVKYIIKDVALDHALIPQMVTELAAQNPKVMVVVSTAIAQFAKGKIKDTPLVYHAITDPVDAGLIKTEDKPDGNMTGSSDKQNLDSVLKFAKSILPKAKTVGMLCLTSDSNDASLFKMMEKATGKNGMKVVMVPVDQTRDIPIRMQKLKGKADFIYVGASGLHAAMPAIALEARKMSLPVFDSEDQSVRNGLALASFGVNYEAVGKNTGAIVAKILGGAKVSDLPPVYPTDQDHRCFISRKLAKEFGVEIPDGVEVVG
jgi:putative ABC transport system substrate-binding protein